MTASAIDGLAGFEVDRSGAIYRVAAKCGKCGFKQLGTDKPNCPPGRIANHFKRLGWDIYRDGVQATCPGCLGKRPDLRRKDDDVSREAIKAQAKMIDLLREHVEADGLVARYKDGWNDARVAEACGLAVAVVTESRETLRPGQLADPDLERLQASIAEERRRFDKELRDVQQFLDNAKQDSARRLADMERRLGELLRRPRK